MGFKKIFIYFLSDWLCYCFIYIGMGKVVLMMMMMSGRILRLLIGIFRMSLILIDSVIGRLRKKLFMGCG